MNTKLENNKSVRDTILKRIKGMGRGSVFTPSKFLDIASRDAIDVSLHRLLKEGVIKRLGRGLYNFPKTHPVLGELKPATAAITNAIAAKDKISVLPAGALAANLLRLSEQVPAQNEYLTDGPSKTINVGKVTINLKKSNQRSLKTSSKTTSLIITAFKYLGKENISYDRISHLRDILPLEERKKLKKDIAIAPAWMRPYFIFIIDERRPQ